MKKVLIGMSGGVDSSVAAFLLKEQGYEVIGATMVLFDDVSINEGCLSSNAANDAKKVCDKLNIKHYVFDMKDDFKKHVINNFIESYKKGFTPNPCVECNKYLKFGALFEKAKELGCDFIATGHYVKQENGKLMTSSVESKDQSYFLFGINKEVIKHILFPLEGFSNKDEIRMIAKDNDLIVYDKKDSQEICFIPNDNYVNFLEKNIDIEKLKGNFIDTEGNILGKHNGIINYTIGQRKGLGISYKEPLYVLEINNDNNYIVLGTENMLYKNELICTNINVLVDELPSIVEAKIRFRAAKAKAKLEKLDNGNIKVIFEEPQRAITKGQAVVFYDNNVLLGGGIII